MLLLVQLGEVVAVRADLGSERRVEVGFGEAAFYIADDFHRGWIGDGDFVVGDSD